MSAKQVRYRRIASVDLSGKGGVTGPEDTCRWDLFNASRVYAPEGWQIDPRDIGRDSADLRQQMRENNLRVDYGRGGRLKAGIYAVRVDSKTVPACLVFFDDRLFFVHIHWEPFEHDELKDKAEIALQQRFGEPVSRHYGKTWVSREDGIYVDAGTLDLSYVYAPIAREQLREMLATYDAASSKKAARSGF